MEEGDKSNNVDNVKSLQLKAMLNSSIEENRNWNKIVLSTHNIKKLKNMIEFVKWREEICLK
jgi:hypothetical protein